MAGTSRHPSASDAIELEAVISLEREEDPEAGSDSDQTSEKSRGDNSKKDGKKKSNIF